MFTAIMASTVVLYQRAIFFSESAFNLINNYSVLPGKFLFGSAFTARCLFHFIQIQFLFFHSDNLLSLFYR